MTKEEIEEAADRHIDSRLNILAATGLGANLSLDAPFLATLRQQMTDALNQIVEEDYLLHLETPDIVREFDKKISEEVSGF
jgi:hypothetical protein